MKNVRESKKNILEAFFISCRELMMSQATLKTIEGRELPKDVPLVQSGYLEKEVKNPTIPTMTPQTPLVNETYSSNPFVQMASGVAGFDVTGETPSVQTPGPSLVKPTENFIPPVVPLYQGHTVQTSEPTFSPQQLNPVKEVLQENQEVYNAIENKINQNVNVPLTSEPEAFQNIPNKSLDVASVAPTPLNSMEQPNIVTNLEHLQVSAKSKVDPLIQLNISIEDTRKKINEELDELSRQVEAYRQIEKNNEMALKNSLQSGFNSLNASPYQNDNLRR